MVVEYVGIAVLLLLDVFAGIANNDVLFTDEAIDIAEDNGIVVDD